MSDLSSKTVVQLKKELVALGLPTNGLKADLVERLRDHQKKRKATDDESDEEEVPKKKAKKDDDDEEEKPVKGKKAAGKKAVGKKAAGKKAAGKKAAAKKDDDDEEEEEEEEKEEEKKEKKGAKKAKKEEKEEDEEEEEEEPKGKGKAKDAKEKGKEETKEAAKVANATTPSSHGDWKWKDQLMHWQTPDLKHSEKIAAFDYDGCLANTSLFKKGPDAWSVLFPDTPRILKELHDKGYKLVIMTNQSDIGKAKPENKPKMIAEKVGRLTGFIKEVNLPFQVLVATAKAKDPDEYRKPAPGMWKFLSENNGGITPDKSKSFFVGDAAGRNKVAGRSKDHSDADKKFAENAGLRFFTEDAFFKTGVKYD